MEEQQRWAEALAVAEGIYLRLAPDVKPRIDRLIDDIMQLKREMLDPVLAAGGVAVCGACGGECCRNGKYHVTLLDIMACLATATEPVAPDFGRGECCPYSGAAGCLMAPCCRPVTCVIFNCDLIEERLAESERESLRGYEMKLRDAVKTACLITGFRLDRPALLAAGETA